MKKFFPFIVFFCITLHITAQDKSEKGYYLFEEEAFSIPTKDLVASFEGFPATPFMATDLEDQELYIGDFKGKDLLLLFWNIDDETSLEHLESIKKISSAFDESLEIVSFVDANRAQSKTFAEENHIDFHIIPNSSIFGEAVYANELGYPRIFMVDEFGVIKKVVPQEAFDVTEDSFGMLSNLIEREF